MRGDQIKGHLDVLVLAVVAQAPAHGYAVIEELRRRSGDEFDLPEGTVYPALYRLQKAGLLASRWDDSGGRRRRVYRLTKRGESALDEQTREWHAFAGAMNRILKGDPWPATT